MVEQKYKDWFKCPLCNKRNYSKCNYTYRPSDYNDTFIKFWHDCEKVKTKEEISIMFETTKDNSDKMYVSQIIFKFKNHNIFFDVEECYLFVYLNIKSKCWENYDKIITREDYKLNRNMGLGDWFSYEEMTLGKDKKGNEPIYKYLNDDYVDSILFN